MKTLVYFVRFCSILTFIILSYLSRQTARADWVQASDRQPGDEFGASLSAGEIGGIVGAPKKDVGPSLHQGAVYVFLEEESSEDNTESTRLLASDGAANDFFGHSVSLYGQNALVGAPGAAVGNNSDQGAAYVYHNIVSGQTYLNENIKLTASDGAPQDYFGAVVTFFDDTAVVGAPGAAPGGSPFRGAAYVFRGVNTGNGSRTEDLKLIASDGSADDLFGAAASLSGHSVLIGAGSAAVGSNNEQGAAYLFRGINTGTGVRTEDLKLTASDGASQHFFGVSVSLSGSTALVGADQANGVSGPNQGAAYFFRNLDSGSGVRAEDLKLIASDGNTGDHFGMAVAHSGDTAIVGAGITSVNSNPVQGAAYIFRNLDSGSGVRTEDVKIYASDGAPWDYFGQAVTIYGDLFAVGAPGKDSDRGRVYIGRVSALTVFDSGLYDTAETNRLSFISRGDWVIGQNTDNNIMRLSSGDTATVTEPGKGVYIGQNPSSDSNRLTIDGVLHANWVRVGDGVNSYNSLEANGVANAAVTVNARSTLFGNGTINGPVTLNSLATVAPGSGVGRLTTGNLFWNPNTFIDLQLKSDGTGVAGVDWDQLAVGALTFNTASPGSYTLILRTTSDSSTPWMLASWDPNTDHIWANFITFTNGVSGFDSSRFAFDLTNFFNPLNGSFSVALNSSGSGIDLLYTAIPEPSSALLLLAGLAPAAAFRLRSRRQTSGSRARD